MPRENEIVKRTKKYLNWFCLFDELMNSTEDEFEQESKTDCFPVALKKEEKKIACHYPPPPPPPSHTSKQRNKPPTTN